MRGRTKWIVGVTLFLWLFALAGMARGAEFSADMVTLQGGQQSVSKVFYKGHLYRMEMEQGGQKSISIGNIAEKVVWALDPASKTYFEFRGSQAQAPGSAEVDKEVVKEIRKLGMETIQGYPCEKTQVVYKDPAMGVMTMWFSQKLGVALRMEYPNNSMTTEYRNIREGPQADSLFKIPAGYRKMAIPGM